MIPYEKYHHTPKCNVICETLWRARKLHVVPTSFFFLSLKRDLSEYLLVFTVLFYFRIFE